MQKVNIGVRDAYCQDTDSGATVYGDDQNIVQEGVDYHHRKVPIVISKTGEIHGSGSQPFKWVSYLSKEEQNAVKQGKAVVIVRGASTHGGNPEFRRVIYDGGRYAHRVPCPIICERVEKMLKEED